MRIAQVMPKIDLIVTTDLLTARQANISSVTSLRSLELGNEKTGKEDVWDKHRKPVSANTMHDFKLLLWLRTSEQNSQHL